MWMKFLKVLETSGRDEAWKFARKNLKGNDLAAAKRYFSPSARDRKETAMRQKAIANVSAKEIRENCQFNGLPRPRGVK